MSILLTKKQRGEAWENTFDKPVDFDHKPTQEEIFDWRLKSVAKAQLKRVMAWGDEACPHVDHTRGKRCCGDCWQELLKEVE